VGGGYVILLDKILVGIVLIAAGTLLLLFLKFAKDHPREWLWAVTKRDFFNFLNFAEKLQPDENIALLSRRKKREKDQLRE
jgi:hypothetical protein